MSMFRLPRKIGVMTSISTDSNKKHNLYYLRSFHFQPAGQNPRSTEHGNCKSKESLDNTKHQQATDIVKDAEVLNSYQFPVMCPGESRYTEIFPLRNYVSITQFTGKA
jgi:hypothetical protein